MCPPIRMEDDVQAGARFIAAVVRCWGVGRVPAAGRSRSVLRGPCAPSTGVVLAVSGAQ